MSPLSTQVRVRGMALLFILANDLVQALDAPGFTLSDTGQHVRCRISIETLLGSWSSFVSAGEAEARRMGQTSETSGATWNTACGMGATQ